MKRSHSAFHWKATAMTACMIFTMMTGMLGCNSATPDQQLAQATQEAIAAKTAFTFATPYEVKGTDSGVIPSPYKPIPLPNLNSIDNYIPKVPLNVEDFTTPKNPEPPVVAPPEPAQPSPPEAKPDATQRSESGVKNSPFQFASMKSTATKDLESFDDTSDSGSVFKEVGLRRRRSACGPEGCNASSPPANTVITKTETIETKVIKDSERLARPQATPPAPPLENQATVETVRVKIFQQVHRGFLLDRPLLRGGPVRRVLGALLSRLSSC